MFNVGVGEVLAIALLALLIFGPNRLPEIMRSIAKAVRTFQVEGQKARDMLTQGLEEKQTPNAPGIVDTPDPGTAVEAPGEAPALPAIEHDPSPAREYEDT